MRHSLIPVWCTLVWEYRMWLFKALSTNDYKFIRCVVLLPLFVFVCLSVCACRSNEILCTNWRFQLVTNHNDKLPKWNSIYVLCISHFVVTVVCNFRKCLKNQISVRTNGSAVACAFKPLKWYWSYDGARKERKKENETSTNKLHIYC